MRLFLSIFAVPALLSSAYADTVVAKGGKAVALIVCSPDATPAEVQAAHYLQDGLSKITGANIPIAQGEPLPEKTRSTSSLANTIFVGRGEQAERRFKGINWASLGEEQTLIRSIGSNLLVAGGRNRGTLYAVDRLLYGLGVRWWAPWATNFPHRPNLVLTEKDRSESPAFEYRDPYWVHSFNADWAVHNYDNGFNVQCNEAQGGKIEYQGFVHTYYSLVPPDKLFPTHPEWFSLINGKRTTQNAQLCTTNPALRDYVVEQVRTLLRNNPKARIISVSQNDCFQPCQCDVCRALVASQGSESALVLDLANYVAEKIEKEFPNVAVDTLAYQWSRHAPQTLRPRKNVIVRLCSIECNFAYPLNDPHNAAFAKDVSDWSKLTNRLYIWDYCTDFANYVEPQPDYFTFGDSMKFLYEHGTKGIFEEGGNGTNGAEMCELKAWVLGQLFWNPEQDGKKLVEEFVHGYYGKAAEPILSYLKLMQETAKTWKLSFASPVSAKFLGYDNMRQSELLWESAEAMVANDPEKLWRVRQGHLAVQYVYLCRWKEFVAESQNRGDRWLVDSSRKSFADAWLKTATTGGPANWIPLTAVSEGGPTPQQFVTSLGSD